MSKEKKDGKKKKDKTMAEVTAGYEQFVEGQKINKKGLSLFNKTIKKAANTKPSDLK